MATADAVNTIAESLKETDDLPRKQISEIVEVLGANAALALLAETRRVQDEGGLAVRDGTRRRTDGGVFFNLAKAQLPKADRNRIFRIRPPKSPESERAAAEAAAAEGSTNGQGPAPSAAAPDVPRPPAPARVDPSAGAGRRRVVEVEVLRTFPKASAPMRLDGPALQRPAPVAKPEPAPPPQELRPLRRIVTVAAPREAPPATADAARERVLGLLKALPPSDQRRVVSDLARELGVTEASPRRTAEPARSHDAPSAGATRGVDDATRERVLAAVTDALGLAASDLAEVLYGDDSPGTKAKARSALERFRKSKAP